MFIHDRSDDRFRWWKNDYLIRRLIMNKWTIDNDLEYTFSKLEPNEINKLSNSKILITGASGFLGQYYLRFFSKFFDILNLRGVVCLDNYILGKAPIVERLESDSRFFIRKFDVAYDSLQTIDEQLKDVDYVFHLASIASPIHYRNYPLETIDSNVTGLRNMLEYYKKRNLKGFLYYSSSEIYGNPVDEMVPTNEEYHGDVPTIGPRACYDESKRMCETISYVYSEYFHMPLRVVRLFNVYGPGLKLNDYRVASDFARMIKNNEDIVVLSNGTPTRTFCYVADSVVGEIKALLYDKFDYFNIGIDDEEISMFDLAKRFKLVGNRINGYDGKIVFRVSSDKHYLTHNPQRRGPDLSKAKKILKYEPSIMLDDGIFRYLSYVIESEYKDLQW